MSSANWYDEWVYDDVTLAQQFMDRGYTAPAINIGQMHIYNDPDTFQSYRLWMYVGLLFREGNVTRLLDVARRGDPLARGKALVALAHLAPENQDYLDIVTAWANADDYSCTVDVSDSVLYADGDFATVKSFALISMNLHDDDTAAITVRDNRETPDTSGLFLTQKPTIIKQNTGPDDLDIFFGKREKSPTPRPVTRLPVPGSTQNAQDREKPVDSNNKQKIVPRLAVPSKSRKP